MHAHLNSDKLNLPEILAEVKELTLDFIEGLEEKKVAFDGKKAFGFALPEKGIGAAEAMHLFKSHYYPHLSGSAGGRYFGFVTGGTTPAALAGDWLVSAFDQNLSSFGDSIAPYIETETIDLLKSLFNLPEYFKGSFVSGATMSNMVGLAQARQWALKERALNAGQKGLYGSEPILVLGGAAHSSIFKSLSILGMGRDNFTAIPLQEEREAIDIGKLGECLNKHEGEQVIVIANAGTVNTVDFDDLSAIAALKKKYGFWLHVDAAFGGFAACSPKFSHLLEGIEEADTITIDAHKWLNVPYDSAMQFTRHQSLQAEVFQNTGPYLGEMADPIDFVHLTPENSRRFRGFTRLVYSTCLWKRWIS